MLKGKCIHPDIMAALALCGHGDKIMIADGNYPLAAKTGEDAELVYLGVRPGLPTVTDVLEAVLSVVEVEKAEVMKTDDGVEPAIFPEFRQLLGDLPLEKIDHYKFYDAVCDPAVKLAISTGESRTYANIILTIGVA